MGKRPNPIAYVVKPGLKGKLGLEEEGEAGVHLSFASLQGPSEEFSRPIPESERSRHVFSFCPKKSMKEVSEARLVANNYRWGIGCPR